MFSGNNKTLILKKLKSHYRFKKDTDFADFLGINPQTLYTWYKRESFDYETIYSKCEGVDGNFLLSGEEPMFKKVDANADKNAVPLVSVDAFAGTGNGVFRIQEKDILAFYDVPEFRNADFMMKVKGNSMETTYSNGDILACKRIKDRTFIQWNRIHVIATKSQGIITKRLRRGSLELSYLCVSDNQDYEPFEIPDNEIDDLALVLGGVWLE